MAVASGMMAAERGRERTPSWTGPPDYRGLEILSPMVRASQLPLRLCCLQHGAGLVYSGVEIDRRILETVRVENPAFGCTDFVSAREKRVVYSTCEEERGRNIFQVGTADAALATQAALHVCKDVRGIDVNMGCTAPFSAQGGMGAALLEKPEVAADIIRSLRRELPATCSVSCKIRMLPTIARTRDFLQLIERSGADAVAVHLRTSSEERHKNNPAHWSDAMSLCNAVSIPVIANGDFFSRRCIDAFWQQCHGDDLATVSDEAGTHGACQPAAIMIARGAIWNPAIFHRRVPGTSTKEPPEYDDVVRNYLHTAARVNNCFQNTKWVLREMLNQEYGEHNPVAFGGLKGRGFRQLKQKMDNAMDMTTVFNLFGATYDASLYPHGAHTLGSIHQHLVKMATSEDIALRHGESSLVDSLEDGSPAGHAWSAGGDPLQDWDPGVALAA
mmetsp:Transcript_77892/g.167089  ORF Transcript_77892/g.167089 Transcript_77892/m.167089 type:complete len:445 (-) Transcript_77892:26-1360(-)